MNPLTYSKIEEVMDGYYPGSNYINKTLIDEMLRKMGELEVTESEFDALIDIHRADVAKARYTPQTAELLTYLPKIRNGHLNMNGEQSGRALNEFNSCVVTHGWAWAFRTSRKNREQEQVLDDLGITAMSKPYATFKDWRLAFIQILHSDTETECQLNNVVDAFDFAASTAPESMRPKLRANAEWFKHIGNGQARKHFPIFRPKRMENREAIKRFASKFLKNAKMAKYIHIDKKLT